MSSAEISDLKSRVGDLERQLHDAKQRLLAAQIAACSVKIGDVVKYRGVEHRVTAINPGFCKEWLSGNPRKKNGEWGTAVRNLYSDWEKSPAAISRAEAT